jgi:hypothetical protein
MQAGTFVHLVPGASSGPSAIDNAFIIKEIETARTAPVAFLSVRFS